MKLRTLLGWGSLGLGLATIATGGLGMYENELEQPGYRIVEQNGAFELRDYAGMLVAETAIIGERNRALNAGFQRLAGYIFGNGEEKIAMTAPVFLDDVKGEWRTRFVMPARYTPTTLPSMPAGVTAAVLPARRMAVVRFTGLGGDAAIAEQEARLRDWLTQRGLRADGAVIVAFYNSPFVAGPFRRNEVMIDLAQTDTKLG